MAFSLEAIYSFFSPPASRTTSPQGSPSLFSSAFFTSSSTNNSNNKSISSATTQTDLPMPPTSAAAFGASAMPPSPAESSTSLTPPSERDFSPLPSPYPTNNSINPAMPTTHRSDSMSSSSTSLTTTSSIISQNDNTAITADRQLRPSAPRGAQTDTGPLDPLSRTYQPMREEPSLDELLARKPAKWSLGHYVKHAKVVRGETAGDQAQRAREFETAKRELLRAKRELDGQ